MNTIHIGFEPNPAPQVGHGIHLLKQALQENGYTVEEHGPWTWDRYREHEGIKIYVGNRTESELLKQLEEREVLIYHTNAPEGDGFYLGKVPGDLTFVSGASDNGVLYGCQELARTIRSEGKLPEDIAFGDAPQFSLRGPALGLQLTYIEPPRSTYEYPITPDRFPWFYDKDHWIEFLDRLLEQRSNVVYIWSGHPFASLVKLDDYPEALEVDEDIFQKNVETFRWLAEEANKRGIWVVLKFYNIHLPLPFAEKHGLKLRLKKPTPLVSDYYRKTIAEFVRSFPNVGLMVCLGEALQGHIYGVEWFNDTIIKGVHDGLRDLDVKEYPPVILRAHAIEPDKVIPKADYPNLYTMAKYNGESLTTWQPRGKWQGIHNDLAELDSVHIINVHILANLEPFRYGAPSFIQKAMQAAKYRLHANGIHLYPLFYWDWPYSPDKTEPRLKQIDRDWIWFETWARYAWNPDRDPQAERAYWTNVLTDMYGDDQSIGADILRAYESFGECAPKLLRRFGITEGNRQTMSLGMTMSQLTNPIRHMEWPDLWESHAPEGERLNEYVKREVNGEPHIGETPIDIINDAVRHADDAYEAINRARAGVTKNNEEFERLVSDVEAIRHLVYFFYYKVQAAIKVLTYKHKAENDFFTGVEYLEEAAKLVEKSVESYRKLTDLTEKTYLYANSMQTPQRKVPIPNGEIYKHWTDCLPEYENELTYFKQHVEELKNKQLPRALQEGDDDIKPYKEAPFKVYSDNVYKHKLAKDDSVFSDGDIMIIGYAEELEGLTTLRFSHKEASEKGVSIDIEFERPSKILIGYFNDSDEQYLQPPNLEVNTHAEEDGGYEPILRRGIKLFAYPSVNVHAIRYEAGRHTVEFGKGAYLFLGVIDDEQELVPRTVQHTFDGIDTLDWLFEA